MRNDPYDPNRPCCLNCLNSFSLAEGEPYDDSSVADYDRLVCMPNHRLVDEGACCDEHPDRRTE